MITAASGEGITLVESRLPPSPTSSTTMSQFFRWKCRRAMAVNRSNSVGLRAMRSEAAFTASAAAHRS